MALTTFREPNQVRWFGVRPAHRGTQVIKDGIVTSAATATIHTVAGTMFYLCGYSALCWGQTYSLPTFLEIYDGVPAIWKTLLRGAQSANSAQWLSKNYWPPLEIPTGYTIKVRCTLDDHGIHVCIDGWEE